MIENFTDIGVRISEQMSKLDLKQVDICKITGISKNAMSNYVNGNRVPDTMAIYKLSKVLKVSIEWLLTGEETALHEENLLDTEQIRMTDDERDMIAKFRILEYEDQQDTLDIIDMKYNRHIKKEMSLTLDDGEIARKADTNETA
ncbi:helix-turn-helix domain-containing protein [Tissierella carlieri]|uniref:helix-turn-helix domain-containing protein n=1 Tax=Tissierella carlieri TaxID=689904 RepID=UPI001C118CDF|nr:helix-turn-helix domain-containing protein [Tissierella carlieri]MBU5312250.1 helix-turn-helix domain-containing protein [Tissierella carlieri]